MALNNDYDTVSDVITKKKAEVRLPDLYAVIMHNDHYTTMDFVVYVLVEIFDHPIQRAMDLMMQVHQTGQATVAVLPYQIAEMKIDEVTQLAEQEEYPLLLTLQKQ